MEPQTVISVIARVKEVVGISLSEGAVLPLVMGFQVLPGIVLGTLGAAIGYGAEKLFQWKLDRQAMLVFARLKSGSKEGFVLYLRPFSTTGRVLQQTAPRPALPGSPADVLKPYEHELESFLLKGARRFGPLIALGAPGEAIGAGRISSTDENWQEYVKVLTREAIAIFCVPIANAGTLWEIQWLQLEGYLSKTVFVMPKALRKKERAYFDSEWERSKRTLAAYEIDLPTYAKDGALFEVRPDGTSGNLRSLDLSKPKTASEALRMLVDRAKHNSQPCA